MNIEHRHRVVVIGAGFGGLAVAKGLAKAPVDVEIIDANNFHLFQPLLYQVATAGLDADDVAYAVRGVFRGQRNVRVHMASVTGIDLDTRTVTLERGDGGTDELSFDTLVVAAGAVSASFGIDGVDEHAIALKDLDDALDLRLAVLERFELASSRSCRRRPWRTQRRAVRRWTDRRRDGRGDDGAVHESARQGLPERRCASRASDTRRGRAAAARGDVDEVERPGAADAVASVASRCGQAWASPESRATDNVASST